MVAIGRHSGRFLVTNYSTSKAEAVQFIAAIASPFYVKSPRISIVVRISAEHVLLETSRGVCQSKKNPATRHLGILWLEQDGANLRIKTKREWRRIRIFVFVE